MAHVNCVAQGDNGLIWVGTDGGDLVNYDGNEFNEIPFDDNRNHHFTHLEIVEDEIYFSSRYSGFFHYSLKSKNLKQFDLRSFLFGEAVAIYKCNEWTYFVGSNKIVAKSNNKAAKTAFTINEKRLKVYQTIRANDAVIILTNIGGIELKNGRGNLIKNWFADKSIISKDFRYGSFNNDTLSLFRKDGLECLQINIKNKDAALIKRKSLSFFSGRADEIISYSYNATFQKSSLLTRDGQIYYLDLGQWYSFPNNYSEPIESGSILFSDLNGDYWVPSDTKGIYKISKEAFTKIELAPIFSRNNIKFIHSLSNKVLLSTSNNKTYIEKKVNSQEFKEYNFGVKGITHHDGNIYLATDNGLLRMDTVNSISISKHQLKNQQLTFVSSVYGTLWLSISGKGLQAYDPETNVLTTPVVKGGRMPRYIYTSQSSEDGKLIYFGSNNGIYVLDRSTEILEKVHFNTGELGSYSGLSTKDVFGTNWFTLDNGIVGFTKEKKTVILNDKNLFNSTLFYTLIADNSGNLILGTNKGLTIFKVNNSGSIIAKTTYDENSNFLGYETHMRSQYKIGNKIFLGTVEGLFQINTSILEELPVPSKPEMLLVYSNPSSIDKGDVKSIQFKTNNAKISSIYYSYRINKNEWILIRPGVESIKTDGLSDGKQFIEARASYDGENFGEISSEIITVNSPIWKSLWFIIAVIGSIFLFNLFLLKNYKKINSGGLIDTKDIDVHLSLAPAILLFTSVSTAVAQTLAPLTDPSLNFHLGATLITVFILFSLYLIALTVKAKNKVYLFGSILKIGLFVLIGDYLWELYMSSLHPFNIIAIILISSMAPYILSKIKDTAIFAIALVFLSCLFIIIIQNPVFPKYYFLLIISIACFLMIFYSYLRYDSLEKLIFVSAIINKGNIPVIAFDRNGDVTYASENLESFVNISHDFILDQNIKVLNDFVPYDSAFMDQDITREFNDGGKYLVPMIGSDQHIRWIEWAFLEFSKNVKIISGQDVSEKMALENTYELLVQHAEDFIYKCDNKGDFKFINDVTFAKLGYTKEDLLNTNSIKIVDPEFRLDILNFYRNHFLMKKLTSYKEFPILKKNGDKIWVGQSITTIFIPGSKSKVDGFIALARDITAERIQQQLIQNQSNSITSSINYARRIQNNLLPIESQFKDFFDEHFIFSRPKDIVSGDFYWMEKVGDNTVLVLGDCTGHGVPGSFMTLLGFNLLNSAVLENRIIDPGQILNRLDTQLQKHLPRGEGKNQVNDAMELTICVFNDKKNEMAYACAGSRFLIYEGGDFTMFKGDNKHAGDVREEFVSYNTHFTSFKSDINLILFTDGFQDQFGGARDKKFSFRRLLELFEENIQLPLSSQQSLISETFEQWVGKADQTDDVTVVSVKRKINNTQ